MTHTNMTAARGRFATPTPCDCYREGSEACRNYSTLTMRVRTLTLALLLGLSVSIAVYAGGEKGATPRLSIEMIGGIAGLLIFLFATTLMAVGWHFQSAFEAVRDSLVEMELRAKIDYGPWTMHKLVRSRQRDAWATLAPYTVVGLIGVVAMIVFFYGGQSGQTFWVPKWLIPFGLAVWIVAQTVWYAGSGRKAEEDRRAKLLRLADAFPLSAASAQKTSDQGKKRPQPEN